MFHNREPIYSQYNYITNNATVTNECLSEGKINYTLAPLLNELLNFTCPSTLLVVNEYGTWKITRKAIGHPFL